MSKKVTRLFEQFAPDHYTIHLAISPDKKSFTGSVTLHGLKKGRPTKRITLHAKDLTISKPEVIFTDKKGVKTELSVSRLNTHKSYEEIRLHFSEAIYPGKYTVTLHFSGKITPNMEGIYPSNFVDDGVKKQLIATQFESHHAREAFPCVDEPEAKATFDVSLSHAKEEVALGNTPVASQTTKGQQTTTVFETTPIMSTYLVAFVTGDLKYKEAKSASGITIRTYATPQQIHNTDFALDVAVKAMDFYEDYYDVPFPLVKCDFVALPDFASGAMENWGLITFREQALLVDEHTSLGSKQWVALVVAHELTHQWFGNLVTMRWWTDLWLNEGFASWMEYLAIDTLFPEWELWTQFAVDEQQLALKLDSLEHTHPIEVTIKHPDEIRTIFDAISYQKGASVIHMLHDYLGADDFRDGLRHYLQKHAYSNTDTVDLWQALEDASGKPVKDFMHAWTSQSGYPLVSVAEKHDHLVISQSKFVSNPSSGARKDMTLWPIPLLTTGLDRQTAEKRRNNIPLIADSPIQLNVGQTGFYRVDYSHDIQQRQLAAIKRGELSAIDRMGLLSDGIEVTKAGYQSVTEYLELLQHYANEDSLSTWEIIAGSLGAIRSTLSSNDTDDSLREAMKPFTRKLVALQLERLGWDKQSNESHLDTLLRPIIIGLAAASDDDSVVSKALDLYNQKMREGKPIDADLRGIIYSTAARKGGQKEYDELLQAYKNSTSSDEKMSICAAMTSFEQPALHSKVLNLITNTDIVRMQDISYWIAYSFMNRHSRTEAWEWLKENWDWLRENVGKDLSFSRTPLYAARNFADKKLIKEYEDFFTSKMEPLLERSFSQGLEIAQTNVAWRERDATAALQWFRENNQ
jgi:puromycin-sensitive aminopeptidase